MAVFQNPSAEAALTPTMRQHQAAKEAHPDALIFFRLGDFYELFYEDAIVAARELQLTLTSRDKARQTPMCGVPYHAAAGYLQKLLRRGYKVALCEQMEDPKLTKTIVRREVTRVLTPGTALDAALDAGASQWLAAVASAGSGAAACVGVASVDLSTGEMRATEFAGQGAWAAALDELARMRPAETLLARGSSFGAAGKQQPTLPVGGREHPTLSQNARKDGAPGLGGAAGKDGAPAVQGSPEQQQVPFGNDNKKSNSDGEQQVPFPPQRGRTLAGDPGFGNDHQKGDSDGALFEAEEGAPEFGGAKTELDEWVFTEEYAVPLLRQGLRVHSLDGMGLGGHPAAAVAAGAIVHYLRATKQGALEHLDALRFYERRGCLELDAVSVRNLELVEPLFSGEGAETTLLHTMDACCTPMGKRLLRAQLLRPMARLEAINARLDAVASAAADLRRREGVRRAMGGVLDLERLLGRIAMDSAGPREVVALGATLRWLPRLQRAVAELGQTQPGGRWASLAGMDLLGDLQELIERTLVEEPPAALGDGSAVRAGVDPELDELRELGTSGRQRIAAIEERERERTEIGSLKVRFNSVFGYYLEITRSHLKAVPADYERKQTLVNAERFTTPELKELEGKILTAQERSGEIERRIFAELRRQLLAEAARVRETARAVAEIDLLACFAHLAAMRGWVRPVVEESTAFEFVAGRHPVVERRLEETGAGRFVPNSLSLCAGGGVDSRGVEREAHPFIDDEDVGDEGEAGVGSPELQQVPFGNDNRKDNGKKGNDKGVAAPSSPSLLLITGPNMGGKSTFLRGAALLAIMAQCGSFVPAERMRLGLVDRIYTRIGAADNVARGRSTFMVEMIETAAILNTATEKSLVLLDEMGRGTATYDGLSLAWATVEHLHDRIGARTLFATHYHELTLLADRLPRLKNARVTVRERDGGIVFLHTVEAGAASKSYGIEVARLAGLPGAVIERARTVLRVHERTEAQGVREAAPVPAERAPALQMTMFTPLSQRIVDRLEGIDVDGLTPREALGLLAELQRELKGGAA